MNLSFEQLKELLTFAIIGLGFVLLHRSVPLGFIDEFRRKAGDAAAKTETPLDDTLLQILDALRALSAANNQTSGTGMTSVTFASNTSDSEPPAPVSEERPRD